MTSACWAGGTGPHRACRQPADSNSLPSQELNLGRNPLLMLPPELGRCKKLMILDISATQMTAEALPPALFSDTAVSRLWREQTQIDEARWARLCIFALHSHCSAVSCGCVRVAEAGSPRSLKAIPGFSEFAGREAAREAKKLDQRRGETGNVVFNDTQHDASQRLA